jgi:AP-1-like transcription factor
MANLFNSPFNPASLSQDQQELLMAALASNRPAESNNTHPPSREVFDFASGSMESPMFASDQTPNFGGTDINNLTDQQFLDYLGRGNNFDFDSVAPGDLIDNDIDIDIDNDNDIDEDSPLGDSPGDGDFGDLHDKRKSPEDDAKDSNENGAKRREGEEKIAKKPGRKPLTSEPTSVSSFVQSKL